MGVEVTILSQELRAAEGSSSRTSFRRYLTLVVSLALVQPGLPEIQQRFAFQNSFRQRENDSLFLVEMTPAKKHGGEKEMTRLFDLFGSVNQRQVLFDQFVLVMERVAVSDLLERRFQRLDKQFVFGLGMCGQHAFGQSRQCLDFRQRLELRSDLLNVIEEIVEYEMFREECLGNLHGLQ
jgi:hypothetical protein